MPRMDFPLRAHYTTPAYCNNGLTRMMIFGLGTGRCGTDSLSRLINNQQGAVCFHETNPFSSQWGSLGTTLPLAQQFLKILSGGSRDGLMIDSNHRINQAKALRKLASTPTLNVIGEVAFYHLPNVPALISRFTNIRFPVLRRDRQETIESYIRKVEVRYRSRFFLPRVAHKNHWMTHDGIRWVRDRFDPCFPKFPGPTLESAIGQYWDYYYATAEDYERRFPSVVRIFSTDELNTAEGREAILSFCGIDVTDNSLVHANRTAAVA